MTAGKHLEIEKKYMIAMPDTAFLRTLPGCEQWEIEQIYLIAPKGETRRIRRVHQNGETRWYKTFKRRVSNMSCEEDEGMIAQEEYECYRREADPQCRPIEKVRYRVPYQGQTLEFDVYPFWNDRAVLEIELESETQQPHIPEWVQVLADLTGNFRYSNYSLAKEIPMDSF